VPQRNTVEIVISATDKASAVLGQIGKSTQTLGKVALAGIAGGAIAATGAVLGLGAGIAQMTMEAAEVEGVASTFDQLAQSIGTEAEPAMESLRKATRGMVADADLMAAGNKFMAMGLAESQEEMAKLSEIATQLGSAMGEGPTESMENFALMLANQSIPRLDSFGISSGQVRTRIEELMAATEGLTREEAFMTAVMEQAEVTMAKVGEQGNTTAASMARIGSSMRNTALGIGQKFLPIMGELLKPIADLVERLGPMLVKWAGKAAEVLGPILATVIEKVTAIIGKFIMHLGTLVGYLSDVWERGGVVINEIFTQMPAPLQAIAKFLGNVISGFKGMISVLSMGYGPFSAFMELLDNFIPEEVIDGIYELRDAVAPFIAKVVEAIGNFVSWKDVLIAVGIGIASVVIPAVIALVASLAPLVAGIAAIVGAVALLRNAWEKDWGGMRTKILELWDAAGPVIESIIAWFREAIPKAVAFARSTFELLASLWQSIIQPALVELGAAFKELWDALVEAWNTIKPIFAELGKTIGEAFGGSGDKTIEFADVVKVAVGGVVIAIKALTAVVTVAAKIIGKAAELAGKFWDKHGKAIAKILGFILKGFKKTFEDIYKLIDKVLKAIGKLWHKFFGNSILLNTVYEFGRKLVRTFISFLAGVIDEVIAFGKELLRRFEDFLADVLDEVIQFGRDLIREFIDFLSDVLSEVIEFGRDLIREFISFLGDVLDEVIQFGRDLIREFIDFLGDVLDEVIQFGRDLIREFVDFLGDVLSEVIEFGRDLVNEFIDFLGDVLSEVIEFGRDLINEFADFLSDVLSDVVQFGQDLISEFTSFLSDVLSDVVQFGQDLISEFTDFLGDVLSDVVQWGADLVSEFAETLGDVISEVIEFGEDLLNNFSDALGDIIDAVIAWGTELYNTFRDVLLDLADVPGEIADTLSQIGTDIIEWVIEGIQSVTDFVSRVIAQFTTWFNDVATSIGEGFQAAVDAGAQIVEQIITGIKDFGNDAGNFVSNILEWLRSKFHDVLLTLQNVAADAVKKLLSVGGQIVQDILDGFEAAKDWFIEKITGWLPDWIQDAIDRAFSPAPGAEHIADAILEGTLRGLRRNQNALSTALRDSVRAAATGVVLPVGLSTMAAMSTAAGLVPAGGIGAAAYAPIFNVTVTNDMDQEELYYRVEEILRRMG
jgi:phage-related protein